MKKIAFVIPWFSEHISGGAEIALRDLTRHLQDDGVALEILTTCVEKFGSDWGTNYFVPGRDTVNGVPVRRFRADAHCEPALEAVNRKLMAGRSVSPEEELSFLNEMVNSTDLYAYIRQHRQAYGLFVFIPYMFSVTYFGTAAAGARAAMIPCFHDESYAHMRLFAERFAEVPGMAFLSAPESLLAHRMYDLRRTDTEVLGLGVDDQPGDAARFRQKYKIPGPFILYAGRKEKGKNVDTLLRYFARYKKQDAAGVRLVLIGGGEIEIPESVKRDVLDLGFVSRQDKYDAYAAAQLLCQPSLYESFSVVIMESWMARRPVLVSGRCAVTKNFAVESGGGLYFTDYGEFHGALARLLQDAALADALGANGEAYVRRHFAWDVVTRKYRAFFDRLSREADARALRR